MSRPKEDDIKVRRALTLARFDGADHEFGGRVGRSTAAQLLLQVLPGHTLLLSGATGLAEAVSV